MIDKKTIFALLYKIHPQGRVRIYVKQTIYPRRDWLIGIFLFTCIVLIGSMYTFYTFNTYKNLHTSIQGSPKPVELLKENTINTVLTKYQKQREEFMKGVVNNASKKSVPESELDQSVSTTSDSENTPATSTVQTKGGEETNKSASSTIEVLPILFE